MLLRGRAQVRIKDIADVEGVRDNQLVGYGLVVGLAGTGDKLDNAVFTRQSLMGMLERLGVNTRDQSQAADQERRRRDGHRRPARLRPQRQRIDVAVSALGDAKRPHGRHAAGDAAAGRRWGGVAVAQGALATGASPPRGAASSVTRGVPTSARIANGATVEREMAVPARRQPALRLGLRNPDLTTARRMAEAINRRSAAAPRAHRPRTVAVTLAGRDLVDMLARIEDLRVEPDSPAWWSSTRPAAPS